MGDLTKNFSRKEFSCSCGCGKIAVDFVLVTALQYACDHFQTKYNQRVSCKITGGNRCLKSNVKALMHWSKKTRQQALASKSQHLNSIAADHKIFLTETGHQIDPDEVAKYYEDKYFNSCGVGRYKNRTHFDVRIIKARWSA